MTIAVSPEQNHMNESHPQEPQAIPYESEQDMPVFVSTVLSENVEPMQMTGLIDEADIEPRLMAEVDAIAIEPSPSIAPQEAYATLAVRHLLQEAIPQFLNQMMPQIYTQVLTAIQPLVMPYALQGMDSTRLAEALSERLAPEMRDELIAPLVPVLIHHSMDQVMAAETIVVEDVGISTVESIAISIFKPMLPEIIDHMIFEAVSDTVMQLLNSDTPLTGGEWQTQLIMGGDMVGIASPGEGMSAPWLPNNWPAIEAVVMQLLPDMLPQMVEQLREFVLPGLQQRAEQLDPRFNSEAMAESLLSQAQVVLQGEQTLSKIQALQLLESMLMQQGEQLLPAFYQEFMSQASQFASQMHPMMAERIMQQLAANPEINLDGLNPEILQQQLEPLCGRMIQLIRDPLVAPVVQQMMLAQVAQSSALWVEAGLLDNQTAAQVIEELSQRTEDMLPALPTPDSVMAELQGVAELYQSMMPGQHATIMTATVGGEMMSLIPYAEPIVNDPIMAEDAGSLPTTEEDHLFGIASGLYVFSQQDFLANDSAAEGQVLQTMTIVQLPDFGELLFDGQPVEPGLSLPIQALEQGRLGLMTADDFTGESIFFYRVDDGHNSSEQEMMMLHIAPVVQDDYTADMTTTGMLGPDMSAVGEIESDQDVDWFQLELTAGQHYQVDLQGASSEAGSLHDPLLQGVYDEHGAMLPYSSNDDGGVELDARLSFTAPYSGSFYLAAGAYADETGSYQLTISPQPTEADDADDFAASMETHGMINVGGMIYGEVSSAMDNDWFAAELQAGQNYRISLEGQYTAAGSLYDPLLDGIYDANGSMIAATRDDDGGMGLNAALEFTPQYSGRFYLSAGAYDGEGSYRLSLMQSPAVEEAAPVNAETDAELSADVATQGSIAAGEVLQATIDDAGDSDWFALHLLEGHDYRFDLEGSRTGAGSLPDPLLAGLYDSNGEPVADTRNDDGGLGRNARLEFTPESSGLYYIEAAAFGNHSGSYQLSLQDLLSDDQTMEAMLPPNDNIGPAMAMPVPGEEGEFDYASMQLAMLEQLQGTLS